MEEGQLSCLNCGVRLGVRQRRRPSWRLTLLGVGLAVILGGVAIGYVLGTLREDEQVVAVQGGTPSSTVTSGGITTTPESTATPAPGEGAAEGEPLPEATGGSQESAGAGGASTDPVTPGGSTTSPEGTATTPTTPGATTTPTTPGSGATSPGGTGTTPAPTTTTPSTTPGASTLPAPTGTGSTRGRRLTWSAGESGFTVVLASTGSQSGAESAAQRARAAGIDAGVLRSSDYGSLRPGYWVAFAGNFSTRGAAAEAATQNRSQGFPDAYARQVRP